MGHEDLSDAVGRHGLTVTEHLAALWNPKRTRLCLLVGRSIAASMAAGSYVA